MQIASIHFPSLARKWAHIAGPSSERATACDPTDSVAPPCCASPQRHTHATLLEAAPAAHSVGLPLGGPTLAVVDAKTVPLAILPDGHLVPPDSYTGGYHGNTRIPPEVALRDGLPARGEDWHLQEHTEQHGCSAFRGTTDAPTDPTGEYGASYWAGEGGWVYEIRHVPTWDVNLALEGRVHTFDGHFRGNLMHGEAERAIPARVPPENIRRCGQVVMNTAGHLYVRQWIENPRFEH